MNTTEPTIMEWIAFGKWLGYDIPTKHRFQQDIWRKHLGFLLTEYPIEVGR